MESLIQTSKMVLYRKHINIMSLSKSVIQRHAAQKASSASTSAPTKSIADVPGLSSAVYKISSEEVGPGASKTSKYKNPEYFCYNKASYYEAEIEMLKYRLPQPSSKGMKKN
ncbi:hypothetical protein L9F63_027078 [Diploptera punctata]|uniref:NADH-ubiquinone oxidoreductase 9 kDa subunit n=1 Tax=Diploptera punctata TaxID=6984 RepID=A0AAD8ADL9_DIPPU|nr:hypothetical protein L9F63_027078 [Diploptera punctata]